MTFRRTGCQSDTEWMECDANTLESNLNKSIMIIHDQLNLKNIPVHQKFYCSIVEKNYLSRPKQFVSSPKRDIFIMPRSRKYFVIRMNSESPKLSSMSKNDLVKSPLQRAFKDIITRCSDVNISVISSRSLWVNTSYSS